MTKLALSSKKKFDNRVVTLHRSSLKIREYNGDAIIEMKKRMLSWCQLLQTEPLDKDGRDILTNFLQQTFGDFSMQEITEAIMWGLKNGYTETYNKLGAPYLSKILVAYRNYRNKQIALQEKENEIAKDKKQIEEMALIPDEDFYNGVIQYCRDNKKLPQNWNYTAVFNHMIEVGDIKLTKEERQMYLDNVIAELQEKQKAAVDKQEYDEIKATLADEEKLRIFCRKRIVEDRLTKFIEDDTR